MYTATHPRYTAVDDDDDDDDDDDPPSIHMIHSV